MKQLEPDEELKKRGARLTEWISKSMESGDFPENVHSLSIVVNFNDGITVARDVLCIKSKKATKTDQMTGKPIVH